jgi:hypothetical protein
LRNRKFEFSSLQRRVRCELAPAFRRGSQAENELASMHGVHTILSMVQTSAMPIWREVAAQRELTYQEICYVVIQAKGLSFSTMLGKISWVCPKGGATFLPARMETQRWAILTAVSSGTS